MSKKAVVIVAATLILISIITGILLTQYWKISTLEKTNNELLKKLEETTQELVSLQENYTDLQKMLSVNLDPPIETRLGIKLMENGQRYRNYLWVTGEVINAGNVTAYNVNLIFKLYTDNGTEVRQLLLGTLKPYETISIRLSVWSNIGLIKSWELVPAATFNS